MIFSKENIKRLVKSLLLLPIQPKPFAGYSKVLRRLGVLPEVKSVISGPITRVLVISLTKHVGDVVMMFPLLEALKFACPQVEIEVAVTSNIASFLRPISYLSQVHGIDAGSASLPIFDRYRYIWKLIRYAKRELANKDYDICLLPRWGIDPTLSAYLAFLTNAPIRCGQDPREEKNMADNFSGMECLMTVAVRGGYGLPEAVRELRLLPAVGLVPHLDEVASQSKATETLIAFGQSIDWDSLCMRLGLQPNLKYGVIAPGASHGSRMWPPERYSEIAALLRAKYAFPFLIVGSVSETALGEVIEALSDGAAISMIGKTNLIETTALLSHAEVFIGNDSGPAHIAAGLGVATIIVSVCPKTSVLEGPHSPSRIRPVGPRYIIVQPNIATKPCDAQCNSNTAHCILGIDIEAVIQKVDELMLS